MSEKTADGLTRKLREKLVGIDPVIDEVVPRVAGWSMVRDAMPKPTVINLWGPTGSGKTELCEIVTEWFGGHGVRVNADPWSLDSNLMHELSRMPNATVIAIHDVHKIDTRRSGRDYPVFFDLVDSGWVPGMSERQFRSSLIFLTGNFDELYDFGTLGIDRLFDADQASELARNAISMPKMKAVILGRLRTEHFARLGTTHIVYPFLSMEDLRLICLRYMSWFARDVERLLNLRVAFDGSCIDWILQEGATATHGARPVIDVSMGLFSSVVSEISVRSGWNSFPLPSPVELSVEVVPHSDGGHSIRVRGEGLAMEWEATSRATEEELGHIEPTDENVSVAVHEAGHLVVYAACKGEIAIAAHFTSRTDRNAVTVGAGDGMPFFFDEVIPFAAANLAGLAAQEVILGQDSWTLGNSADIMTATTTISNAVLMTSPDGTPLQNTGRILPNAMRQTPLLQMDESAKEAQIREWMERAWNMAKDVVTTHRDAVMDLANLLMTNGVVKRDRIVEVLEARSVPFPTKRSFSKKLLSEAVV